MRRARYRMPAAVRQALRAGRDNAHYDHRPAYEQNDSIGRIARAANEETRLEHTTQMVVDLKKTGVSIGAAHAPLRRVAP